MEEEIESPLTPTQEHFLRVATEVVVEMAQKENMTTEVLIYVAMNLIEVAVDIYDSSDTLPAEAKHANRAWVRELLSALSESVSEVPPDVILN